MPYRLGCGSIPSTRRHYPYNFRNPKWQWGRCMSDNFGYSVPASFHYCSTLIFILPLYLHLFCSVLWQVHRLLQSEFSKESDLVLPPVNFRYPLFSLRTSSSSLRLPRLPIISILPSTFPSITCLRRQFLRKMWPIQLPFLLFTVCRIFLSHLTLCTASSFLTRSVLLIFYVLV
jgi:hypothetical protein